MLQKKSFGFLGALMGAALLTACGGSGSNFNQTALPMTGSQPAWSANGTSTAYAYPTPKLQTNGTAQAVPGGAALATPNGYVYEQGATASGYGFYNAQNPCLYPQPGQQASCSGSSSYYAQQPRAASTGYPTTPAYAANTAYTGTTPAYGASTPAYGTHTAYPSTSAYASNPYGATTQANPYATGNAYGTSTQANPYATGNANPYGAPATSYGSQAAPTAVAKSEAERARSRIAPAGVSTGTGTGNSGKKGITF